VGIQIGGKIFKPTILIGCTGHSTSGDFFVGFHRDAKTRRPTTSDTSIFLRGRNLQKKICHFGILGVFVHIRFDLPDLPEGDGETIELYAPQSFGIEVHSAAAPGIAGFDTGGSRSGIAAADLLPPMPRFPASDGHQNQSRRRDNVLGYFGVGFRIRFGGDKLGEIGANPIVCNREMCLVWCRWI